VLRLGVQAIAEVVTVPGLINLDFADIRAIMKNSGPAWMSVGKGKGTNRAVEAAKNALASPMLDVSISGAKGVLFNVTGGSNLTLFECNEAADVIAQSVDPDANIIFGVVFNPQMEDEVQITIIATGFTAQYGSGVPTEVELRRLLRGATEDSLDVPSFLRRGSRYPNAQAAAPQPAGINRMQR